MECTYLRSSEIWPRGRTGAVAPAYQGTEPSCMRPSSRALPTNKPSIRLLATSRADRAFARQDQSKWRSRRHRPTTRSNELCGLRQFRQLRKAVVCEGDREWISLAAYAGNRLQPAVPAAEVRNTIS